VLVKLSVQQLNVQNACDSMCIFYSDVTQFEVEFDSVWSLNVFNRFQIWRMFEAPCCGMRIRGKILFCDSFHILCTKSQRAQKNLFFSQIQPTTQTTVIEYFLLHDVLHCTNMNSDFIDFMK